MSKPEPPQLQLQMPPDVQRGAYANQVLIANTKEEFVFDFVFNAPPQAVVNARVILAPAHAKRLLQALQQSIAQYEAHFGEIDTSIPEPPARH
ncbi:MAG: DUF3467 domain-containing protein [Zetaproteobacteria bacterium]|nr:MAG: DUF3467 domain-containing protein [Zetaproteobacteria bacterium]